MTKSLIIDLGLGNLEQDTPVRVKLWWNSEQKRADEYNTNLPPDTILPRLYKIWQKLYDIRYQTVSSRSSVTLLAKKPIPTYIRRCPQWNFDDLWQNIDNLSDDLNDNNLLQQVDDFISLDAGLLDLSENISSSDINKNLGLAQQKLEERFNTWLQYQEFINCQHQWDKNEFLDINDEIFVIFQIQDHLIRKLPWHQWNFFDKYPLATHGFGSLSYQGRFVRSKSSNQVEILAILCDDEGIDLQQERIIFDQLVNDLDVKIDFMTFPFNRKQLEERLEKGCDILFFAGHSKTQSESGHIYINDQESVTINDLNNSFEAAIDHGLRLAIFNSCDGLGLANDLAKLNISHVIVMKEQVSNFIAQEFFRYFLEFFAHEKYPIFLAVQEARNKLKKHDLQHPGASFLPALCTNPAVVEPLTWENLRAVNTKGFHADWGNVPPVNHFFGRTEELEKLKQWIVNERCRVLAIVGSGGIGKTGLSVKLGQGGIGKTDLSVKLARGMQGEFDYIIWRSLLNAPPFIEITTDIIKFLSHQQETNLPESPNTQINTLLGYLKQNRCLLILDNIESILEDGKYRDGYGVYGEMFQQIRQEKHQSCLLLTSRVIPPEIESRRYKDGSVRLLELTGLRETEAVKKIFQQIGEFRATDENWEKLIEVYGGNPLFLELSAGFIKEQYQGNIGIFLEKEQHLLEKSIEDDLLNWHFQRLNKLEKEIIYWLAINRELVSESELLEDLLSISKLQQVNKYLQSLKKKIPLEKIVETSTDKPKFTLQPVIIEYITKRLINQIVDEIRDNQIELFNTHALFKAQGKEYIKDIQIRLILKPIIEQLLPKSEFRNIDNNLTQLSKNIPQNHLELIEKIRGEINNLHNQINFEHLLIPILSDLKKQPNKEPGYAAGNLLNLLIQEQKLKNEQPVVSNYDFSNLTVWQADLQNIDLPDVNFAYSDLTRSVFTQSLDFSLSIAISHDNKLLALGNGDGSISIWQLENYQYITNIPAHTEWIYSLAFSPDDQLIVSSSYDYTLKIWQWNHEINQYEYLRTCYGHTGRVREIVFSSDGKLIASGSVDKTVRVWDVETGKCQKILQGHTAQVNSVSFSADNQFIVSGSGDCTVKIWEIKTNKCQTLQGDTSWVLSVAYIPHSNYSIVSGTDDGTLRLWTRINLQDYEEQILVENSTTIWDIACSNDGKLIATGHEDKNVRVWNLENHECIKIFTGHKQRSIKLVFSADNKTIITLGEDRQLIFWDLNNSQPLRSIKSHNISFLSVFFSHDYKFLVSGSSDGIVRLWNRTTNKCVKTFSGHSSWVWFVAFSPDDKYIASGGEDNTVRLWNLNDGTSQVLTAHSSWVMSVAFSLDGKFLASASNDETVKIWDLNNLYANNYEAFKTLSINSGLIRKAIFHPQNSHIIATCGQDKLVRIWDIMKDAHIQILKGHTEEILSISFSYNGKYIVSSSQDQTIKIWDTSNGNCLNTLKEHTSRVRSINFSCDGNYLVSCDDDHTVKLWDVRDLAKISLIKNWQVHNDRVWSVAFSPDSKYIASCSSDQTIRLWDIQTYYDPLILRVQPYNGMSITGIKGLTEQQKSTLKILGAVEDY